MERQPSSAVARPSLSMMTGSIISKRSSSASTTATRRATPTWLAASRVAVVDADEDRFEMIDPVIIESEGRATAEEGCLSIPEIYGEVSRPERIVLEATDRHGNRFHKEATGLKARAIQHELDHLDGILFLDHLSLVKRQILLARYRREHKDDSSYLKEVQPESARSE